MKYRCLDCGAVYDRKIEYCECGNNTFEIIEPPVEKTFSREKTPPEMGEIVSWSIFSFCLILSLIILFVVPNSTGGNNPVQTTMPLKNEEQKAEKKDIPDIEKIWKDPEPQPVAQPVEPSEPAPVVIIQKIIKRIETPVSQPKTQNISKPVQQTSVPKTQTVNKPVQQQTKPKTQVNSQPKTQTTAKSEVKKEQKTTPQQTKPAKPAVSNDPAVTKYKNILREVLLSKLAVSSIPGGGTCVIEFSVDSTGKLINRKFVQYADNKAMNDAIYYMLMRVPKFQPPPAAYKGEAIRIKFHINNGAYEISFQ